MNKRFALAQVKVPDDEAADAFPGTFDVILSTDELDRDEEAIEYKAFDPLPDHITFDVDHGMTTETTVGSGTPTYEKVDGRNALRVRGTWSSLPRAQAVRTLVREKHIRTTSVAYMFAKYEQKNGTPTVTKAELLNGAFVSIPSNRGAVVLSAKAYADRLAEAGPVLTDDGPTVSVIKAVARLISDAAAPARVSAKAPGLSANELRELLGGAVDEVHGKDRSWCWLRDYGDDWLVFSKDGGGFNGLYRQSYSISGSVVTLDGDTESVFARTVYETVADNTPKSAAPAATSSASVVTRALASAGASLALHPDASPSITQGG